MPAVQSRANDNKTNEITEWRGKKDDEKQDKDSH